MSFVVICDGLPDVYGYVSGLWGGEMRGGIIGLNPLFGLVFSTD